MALYSWKYIASFIGSIEMEYLSIFRGLGYQKVWKLLSNQTYNIHMSGK